MSATVKDLGVQISKNQNNILALQTEISLRVAEFQTQLSQAQKADTELREAMVNAMEASGNTQPYEDENILITYVKPGTRTGIDTTMLQLEEPKIYEKYKKITNVRSQVRIKVKS